MILVLMGAAGSGKSTIGRLLSERLKWPFFDGDDFHPPANVKKMAAGIPLTDEDRGPWLDALKNMVADWRNRGMNAVLACSALKHAYRERLGVGKETRLVYLKADRALLAERLGSRKGHFLPATLLASQLAILEEPASALVVDASQSPETVVDRIVLHLGLDPH
jgi:gluconokinase